MSTTKGSESFNGFSEVAEYHLPAIAQWFCESANLPLVRHAGVLEMFRLQYGDPDNTWRPNARVMVRRGRPLFMLEVTTGHQAFLTAPPGMTKTVWRLRVVWHACLVQLLENEGLPLVRIDVLASRTVELLALESLGCQRDGLFRDNQGLHFRFVCRPGKRKADGH